MLEDFIPKMHGSWSIWLASTLLGFGLANSVSLPVIAAFMASLFLLFSIQPAHMILTGRRGSAKLYIPLAGFTAFIVFLLLVAARNNLKAYAAVGAVALTLSAPLLYSATGYPTKLIMVSWALLILLSLWAVTLAEDALFSKKYSTAMIFRV